MIPTTKIKAWVDYEVEEGLFVINEVKYNPRANTVEVTFEAENGDRIRNRYDLDHEFGEYAWNRLVTAVTGRSGDGGVSEDELVNKFVLLTILASEPTDEGRVFYNVKRADGTDKTFPLDGETNLEIDLSGL